jgi:hypothetical protein
MEWARAARETIDRVARTIPDDATMKDRKAAIDAAYPFGPRSHWPYKAWLKARKTYLSKFGPVGRIPPAPLFPDWERDPVTGRPIIPTGKVEIANVAAALEIAA